MTRTITTCMTMSIALVAAACGGDGGSDETTIATDVSTTTPSPTTTTGETTETTSPDPDTSTSTTDPGETTAFDDSSSSTETTGAIELPPFSFFVTSLAALQELSGSPDGFGGDLSFGEVGPGAGLRGADAICAAIAEMSMPGASTKQWRAFLSASMDENGNVVNAIDRIGPGPWFDRLGRVVANTPEELQHERPQGGDPTVAEDLPNEDGVPNHRPDPTQPEVDNHDTLTGSDEDGRFIAADLTCSDWTSSQGQQGIRPRIGHSWPRNQDNGRQWISDHDAGGCAPGVNIQGGGGPQPGDYTVGAGGGYGGIYCFALEP